MPFLSRITGKLHRSSRAQAGRPKVFPPFPVLFYSSAVLRRRAIGGLPASNRRNPLNSSISRACRHRSPAAFRPPPESLRAAHRAHKFAVKRYLLPQPYKRTDPIGPRIVHRTDAAVLTEIWKQRKQPARQRPVFPRAAPAAQQQPSLRRIDRSKTGRSLFTGKQPHTARPALRIAVAAAGGAAHRIAVAL